MLGLLSAGLGVLLFLVGGAMAFIGMVNASLDNEARASAVKTGFSVLLAGIFFVAIPSVFVIVDAGNVGVQNTFGIVDSNTLQPGFHLKNPFTDVIQMSTRTQKYMDYGSSDVATITALSNDGLSTTMGIAVNYHIVSDKAPDIYKQVGPDYTGVVMVNPIHSVPRDLISKYDTKTLYSASLEGSTDRAKLEQELYTGITDRLDGLGVPGSIIIEQVAIRNIDFPDVYKNSIAAKMQMDTEIQQKALEVKKQEMEANRMRVEAQGIADYQRIVSEGISEQLIQWKSLETLEKIGNNKNMIVVVPAGQGVSGTEGNTGLQMPLMLPLQNKATV